MFPFWFRKMLMFMAAINFSVAAWGTAVGLACGAPVCVVIAFLLTLSGWWFLRMAREDEL